MDGIDPFNMAAEGVWQREYRAHVKKYWKDRMEVSTDVTVTIEDLNPPYVQGQRRGLRLRGAPPVGDVETVVDAAVNNLKFQWVRSLQDIDKFVVVMYTQDSYYGLDRTETEFIQRPFSSAKTREDFVNSLKETNETNAFQDLSTVSMPTKAMPPTDGGDEMSTITIIIIVCAIAGGLLLLGGGYFLFSRYKKKGKDNYGGDHFNNEAEGKPPSQLQLSTLGGPDEVSTLAEPTPRIGVHQSGESLAGYGDQSVVTMDFDYSKAYGGGGDSIVSSVGGTLGSGTRAGATTGSGTAGLAAAGGGGGQSIFSDDASFDQHYRTGARSGVKEELIDIYAPPGKLGVVIDTPDEGPPVVHAIKDSSVIADQLKVGDKLVAVDDEDVRSMTAIKVSKMISRKSANPTRKLTVIRTTLA